MKLSRKTIERPESNANREKEAREEHTITYVFASYSGFYYSSLGAAHIFAPYIFASLLLRDIRSSALMHSAFIFTIPFFSRREGFPFFLNMCDKSKKKY